MSESSIRVASVSLAELFSGKHFTANEGSKITGSLSIPEYQRPYRWSASQVADLAHSLHEHFKECTHHYYLGSLILHQDGEHLNIIDGQQRITSMGILCLLSGLEALPVLTYRAPESQQNIRANLAALRDEKEFLFTLSNMHLDQINVTLVVTSSEDDAYKFFETQNSGGVRLSGIDIAKAHHLRAVVKDQCDVYAKCWEEMDSHSAQQLPAVVEAIMRARLWSVMDWKALPDSSRSQRQWRDLVVAELATATGSGQDMAYRLCGQMGDPPSRKDGERRYELRQPLQAGVNSIHYLQQFAGHYQQYCPTEIHASESDIWRKLYAGLVTGPDASVHLRRLFDAALLQYLGRFGVDKEKVLEAGLWLYRFVYSHRLSRDKARFDSVQKFAKETMLLDRIATAYTHEQLVGWLKNHRYEISTNDLEKKTYIKRRHIHLLCQHLDLGLSLDCLSETDVKQSVQDKFDDALCKAIKAIIEQGAMKS